MDGWQAITRGQPEVDGVDADYPGLLNVRVPLSAYPPDEWQDFFLRPVGVGLSMSMHSPDLRGDEVVLRPPDSEVERYVKHVDERIVAANARYEAEVLPKRRAALQRADAAAAQEEERLRAARE